MSGRLIRTFLDTGVLITGYNGQPGLQERALLVGLVVVTAPELGQSAQDNFMLNILASFADYAEFAIMRSRSAEVAMWPAFQ